MACCWAARCGGAAAAAAAVTGRASRREPLPRRLQLTTGRAARGLGGRRQAVSRRTGTWSGQGLLGICASYDASGPEQRRGARGAEGHSSGAQRSGRHSGGAPLSAGAFRDRAFCPAETCRDAAHPVEAGFGAGAAAGHTRPGPAPCSCLPPAGRPVAARPGFRCAGGAAVRKTGSRPHERGERRRRPAFRSGRRASPSGAAVDAYLAGQHADGDFPSSRLATATPQVASSASDGTGGAAAAAAPAPAPVDGAGAAGTDESSLKLSASQLSPETFSSLVRAMCLFRRLTHSAGHPVPRGSSRTHAAPHASPPNRRPAPNRHASADNRPPPAGAPPACRPMSASAGCGPRLSGACARPLARQAQPCCSLCRQRSWVCPARACSACSPPLHAQGS